MKCIDAIEGTVKRILVELHETASELVIDDAEYIRVVRAIITGTESFIRESPELSTNPDTVGSVLYDHIKEMWLKRLLAVLRKEAEEAGEPAAAEADDDYYSYYFNQLYKHGTYPL